MAIVNSGVTLTVDCVKTKLLTLEDMHVQKEESETALAVKKSFLNKNKRSLRSNLKSNFKQKIKCFICDKERKVVEYPKNPVARNQRMKTL